MRQLNCAPSHQVRSRSIPKMEETLGTVYCQQRGLLGGGQCLKCCKMSNKVFIAKIRSFFEQTSYNAYTQFIYVIEVIFALSQAVVKSSSTKTRFLQCAAFVSSLIREFTLEQAMVGYTSTLSLTSALYENRRSRPRRARFIPVKEIRCSLYRRPGGPQGRYGRERKIGPRRHSIADFLARIEQPNGLSYRGPHS